MLGGLPITGGAKVRFSNVIVGSLMYAVLNSGLSILGYEPQVQQLIATLKSEEFKQKILSLGGYTVENPGEIISLG